MAKTTKKPSLEKAASGLEHKTVTIVNNNFDNVTILTDKLNKNYKTEVIKTGDDIPKIYKVRSQEPAVDFVYDGGYPISRLIEALGQEHTGKTRNGLIAMGKWQKYCFGCHKDEALTVVWETVKKHPSCKSCKCKYCDNPKTCIQVMVDIEGTTDPKFMDRFGIDTKGVLYFRPDTFSKACDIVDAYLRNPQIGLIMVDSIASIGSDKEVDNKMEDNKMNQNALFTNQMIRKWQAALNSNTNVDPESPTTIYLVNQSYSSIGMFSYEIAQGGRGLRHGKAISTKFRMEEKVMNEQKTQVLGVHIIVENMKNKTGMPYRKTSYYVNLEEGEDYCQADKELQVLDLALMYDLVQTSGSWYSRDGNKLGQGKGAVLEMLKSDTDFFNELKEEVYVKIG
jgi:RecA/RadA recombinase